MDVESEAFCLTFVVLVQLSTSSIRHLKLLIIVVQLMENCYDAVSISGSSLHRTILMENGTISPNSSFNDEGEFVGSEDPNDETIEQVEIISCVEMERHIDFAP